MRKKQPHKKPRPPEREGPADLSLSDDWRAWIVENAARGIAREELIETLATGGVPADIAAREVHAILTSPVMPGARRLAANNERLELLARLLRTMADDDTRGGAIERRETVSARELYDHYYSRSRPVVLTRILDDWPALGKWTPAYFAERFGDVEVQVVTGRDSDPYHDLRIPERTQTMTMRAYVARVLAAGTSNDLYMVSNNRALEIPGLLPLLDDLTPPEDMCDRATLKGGASLWFGPGGTVTKLHHDTTNNLICQLFGKKRLVLISPLETALLPLAQGYFCEARVADLAAFGLGDVRCHTVELSAGEALFLPAGWWHEVTALETSIHVSLLAFRRKNALPWYVPGAVRRA